MTAQVTQRWIPVAVVMVLPLVTTTAVGQTLGDPSPFHLSPGDYFTVPVTGGTFTSVGDVVVRFTPFGGGAATDASPEDVVPNTTVGARVPATLAVGQYTLKLVIMGTPTVTPDPNLWIRQRAFRLVAKPPAYLPFPSGKHYKDTDFADVDNDGFLDLFEANSSTDGSSETVDRLLINRRGPTAVPADYTDETIPQFENTIPELPSPNVRTYDADFVDLDLDGDQDLVRIDRSSTAPIRLFLNDGTGDFTERTVARSGIGPALLPPLTDITAILQTSNTAEVDRGDVDGDGRPDLVLSNWATTRNVLLLNRLHTTGRFEIANGPCGSPSQDAFCQIVGHTNRGGAFGEFNGDGRLDIIFPTMEATTAAIVLLNAGNDGSGVPQFTVRTDWVKGPAPGFGAPSTAGRGDLKVADLDGDGDDDVAIGSPYTTEGIILWNDAGTRLVELDATRFPIPARGYDVEFGDLDRDGDIDIIFAHFGAGAEKMMINRGGLDANMRFDEVPRAALWFRESAMGEVSETPSFQLSVSAGDYDLDGDLDLVTGGFAEVRLWRSDLFDQPGEDRDWVFVLDRTRSMISGGKDFFAPSRDAIVAFLAERRAGDATGLVTYDYAGASPNNPNAPDDATKAQVASQVGAKSISDLQTDVSNLVIGSCTGFCTAIGWAIKTGKEVAEMAPDPAREKVVVLVTDGRQNQSPHPDVIIPTIPSNVRLYTIALGSETDDRMLSALATNGGKFYFAGRSTDYASVQSALREIDTDLEGHSTGKQPLFPLTKFAWARRLMPMLLRSPSVARFQLSVPAAAAAVIDPQATTDTTSYFVVDPADRQVRFTLNWRLRNAQNHMVVVDPKGRVYPPGNNLMRERRGTTFHVIEVLDPLSGVWQVRTRVAQPDNAFPKLTAMASSDVQLTTEPEFPLVYVGEPLVLNATLSGWTAGLQGEMRLLSPSKTQTVIVGQPRGTAGIVFRSPNLTEPGTYRAEILVFGTPARPLLRAWQSAIHVAEPTPDEPDLRTVELSLDRSTLTADGAATATARLRVRRRDGAPLSGGQVSFVVSGATLTGSVQDHGEGRYSQRLTAGTVTGSGWVRARVGVTRLSDSVAFALTPGAVDPVRSRFTILIGPLNLCTNQQGRFAIRVMPVDPNGNATSRADVEIERVSGPRLRWAGSVRASGRGEIYTREFWGPTTAGVYEFSATVNGITLAETRTLEVFEPTSAEGLALGCVEIPMEAGVLPPGFWFWLLLLLLLLMIVGLILWLRRRATSP